MVGLTTIYILSSLVQKRQDTSGFPFLTRLCIWGLWSRKGINLPLEVEFGNQLGHYGVLDGIAFGYQFGGCFHLSFSFRLGALCLNCSYLDGSYVEFLAALSLTGYCLCLLCFPFGLCYGLAVALCVFGCWVRVMVLDF